MPGCYGAITEELTLTADTRTYQAHSAGIYLSKSAKQLLLSRDYSAAPKRFAWHTSDCQRLHGDRQQGARGGIWSWHILRQSSTQLAAKSCATIGTHHCRGHVLTAGAPDGRLGCPKSAFSPASHFQRGRCSRKGSEPPTDLNFSSNTTCDQDCITERPMERMQITAGQRKMVLS